MSSSVIATLNLRSANHFAADKARICHYFCIIV